MAADVREEVTIHAVAHGGAGIGRAVGDDARVWFIDGALPGDVVLAERAQVKPRMIRGRMLEVLRAGPLRQEPMCALASTCGGCGWQHVVPAAQAELKARIVADLTRRLGVPVGTIVGSPAALGYRRRARAHFERGPGGLRLGFFGRGGHGVVDTPACPVLDAPLRHAFARMRELGAALPERGELHGLSDGVRAIVGVAAQAEIGGQSVGLPMIGGETERVRARLTGLLDRVLVGIVVAGPRSDLGVGLQALEIDGPGPGDMSPRTDGAGPADMSRATAGPDLGDMSEGAAGSLERMPIRTGPFGFAQAQAAQNAALVEHVLRLAGGERHPRGLELFAGAGNFTRGLATRVRELWAVETDAGAVAGLRRLAARAGVLGGAKVHVEREPAAAALRRLAAAGERFELVVLDPPRAGLGVGPARDLARVAGGRTIYVACDPATLARDLAALVELGHRVVDLAIFDLMPMTPDVEVVAVLEAGSAA